MRKYLLSSAMLGLVSAAPAFAQYNIGVAGPLTGSNAAFGTQLTVGAAQAVADINAAGGIMGQNSTRSPPMTPAIRNRPSPPPTH